jgi:hypothetical protein
MNRIIITFQSPDLADTLVYPIMEDFQIETVTEFSSFAELCPTISSLVDLGITYESASSGGVSAGGFNLRSVLDAPRWQRTNPVKITVDMFFYTKTDPYTDVLIPINSLIGSHLPRIVDKKIKVPGLNATNVKNLDKTISNAVNSSEGKKAAEELGEGKSGEKELKRLLESQYSVLFSVLIPGVIFLPAAFVFAIAPTYSKHVTEQGYPLWASVNLQIQSLTPALAEYFRDGMNFTAAGNVREYTG